MRLEAGRGGGRIPMRRAGGAGGAAEQVSPYAVGALANDGFGEPILRAIVV